MMNHWYRYSEISFDKYKWIEWVFGLVCFARLYHQQTQLNAYNMSNLSK
jgi:hypothetical protein